MKRRFEFRLQRVARVRELEERVARAERIQAEGSARAAEQRAEQARSVVERSRAWLREILAGQIDPRRALATHRLMDGELVRLRRAIESARTQRTQAERMAAAHRTRKSAARALEELRARARVRHEAELMKDDNAQLDEVAQRLNTGERSPSERTRVKREADSRVAPPATDHGPGPPPPSAP